MDSNKKSSSPNIFQRMFGGQDKQHHEPKIWDRVEDNVEDVAIDTVGTPNVDKDDKDDKAEKLECPKTLSPKEISKLSQEERHQYIEGVEDYLNSLVVIKGNWKKEICCTPKLHAHLDIDYDNNADLSFIIEIEGKPKKTEYGQYEANVVLYNERGKILFVDNNCIFQDKLHFQTVTSSAVSTKDLNIATVAKILVYWSD